MNVREELGQISWFTKRYREPRRWLRQLRVIRHLDLPALPRQRRRPGEVWGVSLVRDEGDVIEATVRHLFGQGVDHLLIADNGSHDGTLELLRRLSAELPRLHVALDREPAYLQSEKMTWLAHHAWRAGADWIVPFDADEFWFARGTTVADYLRRQTVGIVHANFHHMVPTVASPEPLVDAEFILDSTPSWPGKVAARSHPLLEIIPGNHGASRVGGETDGLFIAHAQYRSPVQVARKVRQGTAAARLTGEKLDWFSPHWEEGSKLSDAGIEDVWNNISHGRPDARLGYKAAGPMLSLHPLQWRTWDPDGVVGGRLTDSR
nr:glycosyltransferase family 2 protein [Propionibacterium sp.]